MGKVEDSLDAWVDRLAGTEFDAIASGGPPGQGPYRTPPRVPYMRVRRQLDRAEARLAEATVAYYRVRSPYLQNLPVNQDLATTSRIVRNYQEAKQEVETLRRQLALVAEPLRARLLQYRRRNPDWPRPISWTRRIRNFLLGIR